jgi:hypothetical protein
MSPTLFEGVAVIVAIIVAWQIGVRIAPDILDLFQRAIDQLNGSNVRSNVSQKPKQDVTIDSSVKKEEPYDAENRNH